MSTQTIANDSFGHPNQSGWPSPWSQTSGSSTLSINSNEGKVTQGGINYLIYTGTPACLTADVYVRFAMTYNGSILGLLGRFTNTNNYVRAYLTQGSAVIDTYYTGTQVGIGSSSSVNLTANTYYWLHFYMHGNFYGMRYWADGGAEPTSWLISGSATNNLSGGTFGIYAYPYPAAQTLSFDHFSATYTPIDYYVSPTGNDTNPGTLAAPFQTLSQMANTIGAGDTAHVLDGTYTISSSTFTINQKGTAQQPITWKSEHKWQAKMQGSGADPIFQNNGDYVTLQGFEVIGDNTSHVGMFCEGSHCLMHQCLVHDINRTDSSVGGSGMDCANSTDVTISENIIYNIGGGHGLAPNQLVQAIYLSSSYSNAINNLIFRADGYGIVNFHAGTNGLLMNNTIFHCGYGGILVSHDSGSPADYMYVANNICVFNGNGGGSSGGGIIENAPTGVHNVYTNNCVHGNYLTAYGDQIHLLNGLVATNTVSADPQFVIYNQDGYGNYRLSSTSPCIAAGTATNAPSIDLDGNPRPFNGHINIGCYEQFIVNMISFSLGGVDGKFSLSGNDGSFSMIGNDGSFSMTGRG